MAVVVAVRALLALIPALAAGAPIKKWSAAAAGLRMPRRDLVRDDDGDGFRRIQMPPERQVDWPCRLSRGPKA